MSTNVVDKPVATRRRAAPESARAAGRSEWKIALVFIAPALVGFLAFFVYPTIRGFYFSLTQYNLLGTPKWVGFDNYAKIARDPLFWNALSVTVEYVLLNIAFQTVIALLLASLMQRLTQSTLLRGALLLPWLISNVIAAMLWFWLLDYQIGLVNVAMEWMGLPKVAFFANEFWAIPTMAFVNVWRHMGYTALLCGHADDPEVHLRGGLDRRQLGVEILLAHDHAAAAPRTGDDPGDHRDRLVPDL